jgi:hypothetical protein
MPTDTFLDRPRARATSSTGALELPFLARDASMLAAFFRVSMARATAALAGKPFHPVRILGGTGVVALALIDYRDTIIGPYREVLAALAVVPEGVAPPTLPLLGLIRASTRRDVGFHALDIPVNEPAPGLSGRELWGFPKFVTEIDLSLDLPAPSVIGVVHAPSGEEQILVLEGRAGAGLPLPAMDLVFYTVRDGRVLRTVAYARGKTHVALGRGLTLRLGRGVHPMSDRLAALGLAGAHPAAAQSCPHFQLVLDAAEPMVLARAA